MSDVIDFLERMGQDSQLRHAPEGALQSALRVARMSPELQAALLQGDQAGIEAVLGINTNVCCMIYIPTHPDDHEVPLPLQQTA
jgi:hypothetical protein